MIPEVSLKMLERSGVIKGGINTIRQNPTRCRPEQLAPFVLLHQNGCEIVNL